MANEKAIRRVDDLGRIVIPKEMRKKLGVKECDPMEIKIVDDSIVISKYNILEHLNDNVLALGDAIDSTYGELSKEDKDKIRKSLSDISNVLNKDVPD